MFTVACIATHSLGREANPPASGGVAASSLERGQSRLPEILGVVGGVWRRFIGHPEMVAEGAEAACRGNSRPETTPGA